MTMRDEDAGSLLASIDALEALLTAHEARSGRVQHARVQIAMDLARDQLRSALKTLRTEAPPDPRTTGGGAIRDGRQREMFR